jgi:hypothetical protein
VTYCPYCPGKVEYTDAHIDTHLEEAVEAGELTKNEDGSYNVTDAYLNTREVRRT